MKERIGIIQRGIGLLLAGVLLLPGGCAVRRDIAVPGNTIAPVALQAHVRELISSFEYQDNSGAPPGRIIDTHFIERRGEQFWEEWVVRRRDRTVVVYTVELTCSRTQGTGIRVFRPGEPIVAAPEPPESAP